MARSRDIEADLKRHYRDETWNDFPFLGREETWAITRNKFLEWMEDANNEKIKDPVVDRLNKLFLANRVKKDVGFREDDRSVVDGDVFVNFLAVGKAGSGNPPEDANRQSCPCLRCCSDRQKEKRIGFHTFWGDSYNHKFQTFQSAMQLQYGGVGALLLFKYPEKRTLAHFPKGEPLRVHEFGLEKKKGK